MKRLTWFMVAVFIGLLLYPLYRAQAQSRPATPLPKVPITYPGDTDATIIRRAQWIEGAKKEGTMVWWESGNPGQTQQIIAEFNKIYPFIEVKYWRGQDVERVTRFETEHAAGRVTVDLTGTGEPQNYPRWRKIGIPDKYADLVPGIEKWDKRTYSKFGDWTMSNHTPMVPMYNTKLISAAEAPKGWEGLLDSRWKGKIGLTSDMKAWYMLALGEKGWGIEKTEDFLKKLKQQEPVWAAGHSAGHNLMTAGEFPIMGEDYLRYVYESQKKGAPVDWVRASPVPIPGDYMMLLKKAPNPNAARLFIEWYLSPQGLAINEKITGYGAAFPGAGTRLSKSLEGLDLIFKTEEMVVKAAETGLIQKFANLLGVSPE